MADFDLQETGVTAASIKSSAPTTNISNDSVYVGQDAVTYDVYRGLVKFAGLYDGTVTKGVAVTSAILSLRLNYEGSNNNSYIDVFRVKKNWVESQVTWNKVSNAANWTNPGIWGEGDDSDIYMYAGGGYIGSLYISGGPTTGVFYDIPLDTDVIYDMINTENYGFFLKSRAESEDYYYFTGIQDVNWWFGPRLQVTVKGFTGGVIML